MSDLFSLDPFESEPVHTTGVLGHDASEKPDAAEPVSRAKRSMAKMASGVPPAPTLPLVLPPMRVPTAAPPSPVLPPPRNLEEVVTRVKARTDLAPSRRRDLVSALTRFARLAGKRLVDIDASPRTLASTLEPISPAAANMTAESLCNLKSLALAALREAGVPIHPGRSSTPLGASWASLAVSLRSRRLSHGLSRFLRYCSEQAIEAEAVDAGVFERFRLALAEDSLLHKPAQAFRDLCRLWNEAVEEVAGWPQVQAPCPPLDRRYALPWDTFPDSFQAAVEAFLANAENRDVLSDHYAPSVRPNTVKMRRKQLHQLASAFVLGGGNPEQIHDLRSLVEPSAAKAALRYLHARNGGKPTKYLGQQAQLLRTVARHWVKADARTVDELARFARQLAVRERGMTTKNTTLLRQFQNPANVHALVSLPPRIFDALGRKGGGNARTAMLALAVELLLMAPMRIGNLTGLEVARHIVRSPARGSKALHLLIPGQEVKNGVQLEMELPAETTKLLNGYLDRYHRQIAPGGSRFLFPNESGSRRSTTAFASAVSKFVLDQTGLRMHVHLFRALAAKLHLNVHPGDLETARRLLGHQNVSTTSRSYTEGRSDEAFRMHDDTMRRLRQSPPVSRPRAGTGQRGGRS